jgi:hypothetical protein
MGGKQSNAFNQKEFNSNWERKEGNFDGRAVYRNKKDFSNEIEEHPIYANN